MGGHPYWYYTPYQTDINTTLQVLRQQEFAAGRYNPVISFLEFPITADSPSPGAQHSSIEDALEASDADGTRSILDLWQISTIPYAEAMEASTQDGMDLLCTSFPLSADELICLFGTEQPTHALVESRLLASDQTDDAVDDFWESIDRGTGRHIILYENENPVEIFFIGYSFD